MVIKQSLVGESVVCHRYRSAFGMSNIARINSGLGNGSFCVEMRDPQHKDLYR